MKENVTSRENPVNRSDLHKLLVSIQEANIARLIFKERVCQSGQGDDGMYSDYLEMVDSKLAALMVATLTFLAADLKRGKK